ncbi:hypothetical protein [Desulfomarina sp.]
MPKTYPLCFRFLSLFLLSSAFFFSCPVNLWSTTTLQHTPPESINSGSRTFLSVIANDREKIESVRVYFKCTGKKDYFFIALRNDVRSKYIGRLPSATPACGKLEYIFLIKNRKEQLIVSQKYTIPVIDSRIIFTPPADKLHIYSDSEISSLNARIPGFTDNFTLSQVQPSLQFGKQAGLYSVEHVSTDTVTAEKIKAEPPPGISSTTLAAAGATVFAVSIGGIAISYSNNSSARDREDTEVDEQKKTTCPFAGTWAGILEIPECGLNPRKNIPWQGTVDRNCSFETGDKKIHGNIEPSTGKINLQLSPELQTCTTSVVHTGSPGGQGYFEDNGSSGVFYLNGNMGIWSGHRQ